jgi:homospermidine synthase
MYQGHTEHEFKGRLVILGFGSIGQGVLPLLLRHIDMRPDQLLVITPSDVSTAIAHEYRVPVMLARLTRQNYRELLAPHLSAGDFLLNLSVEVSSVALIELCQSQGAMYLDTCIEPWPGGFTDPALDASARSNHALREAALALRAASRGDGPTAVLAHGANPGLVSHLVKRALLDIAAAVGAVPEPPRTRAQWAALAAGLGVRVIHISERDTQVCARRKAPGEFVNTWSVRAFVDECCQPAELGWGSHEKQLPVDGGRHHGGTPASIFLNRPGASTRGRSWAPRAGPFHAFLITHNESISIADYFTVGEGERPHYRPTVHYAYHPCDDAVLSLHELAGHNWRLQPIHTLLKQQIQAGIDELGVLLMGHAKGAYWYGSPLSIEQARALCPHNSATSLQVTAAVMAGVVWAMKNPARGVIEPDEMPFDDILALCEPYLGGLVGVFSDWTPLAGRDWPFQEDLDRDDPWQFRNFRVS